MSLHKEISFEVEVCDWLGAHGWLHESGDWERYDRARALYPPDLVAWMHATQPKAWEGLAKNHGASATSVLLDRIRRQLDDRGTLDVMRHGVEMIGLKQQLSLAQFRPALAMNADIAARYEANRLRVVRALFAGERELHRSCPLPKRTAGRDRRTQDGLHPERSGRCGPVSVRPAASSQGAEQGAAAELPKRRTRAFRGQQQRSPDDDAARRRGHALPAIQQGQRRRRGQQATLKRAPDKLSVGGSLGTRQLARNPRPLHRRAARCEAANQGADLPPVSPARRHPPPARRRAGGGAGTEISDPALGRFRQDELHRMVGAFPRGPARRRKRETVLDRDRCLRPQRDRQPASGGAGRLRAHQGRRHDDQERGIEQEWPARRCARRGQEDHRLHDPNVSLCAGGRASTGGDGGQAVRSHRGRGAQLSDGRGGRETQGGTVA